MATPEGRVITLDVPGWPGSLAGQHVDIRLTAEDGYQAVRSYSLASYGPSQQMELAVDRLPDGEVSPYLVDDARPGDQLEVKGPIGGYFVWRPTQSEPIQLIAGGSGVVPLMAMIRAHRDSGNSAEMRLLYSVRNAAHAYFAEELAATTDLRLHWQYTATAGRVNADVLAARTISAELEPTVYVCGSNGFVELVATLLVRGGHDPRRIRTERYGGA
ncbi:oxidoreductase [Mycobacterium sp. MS1601]|uniref:FAD-binding oxidoreductase n=1 Tax=Mycobacterium sp. MS1601 TaxID=1936029 RepID=UPI00097936BB|nr:FAD-binding oxidoreductase [Mycobacterium sp. MS1601]AQA06015.1 oxidoreductase [Mycobacterium sp. MS1601]